MSVSEADRFAFLAEVSRCLSDSLDCEATLATIAGMSLPHLDAWCIVDVVSDATDGEASDDITRLVVLHPDPEKEAAARELHRRYPPRAGDLLGAPRVVHPRRPEIMFDVPDAALVAAAHDLEHLALLRTLGVTAYVIAPMVARDRLLGAITFVSGEAGRRFSAADLLTAEDLARRAALAVDNARLYRAALAARESAEVERTLTTTRTARLQALSGALAVASTRQEVADAVVARASAVLDAVGIVIAHLADNGHELEIMSAGAMPDNERRDWARFPLSAPIPLAEVARSGQPIFLESRLAWEARYPGSTPMLEEAGHHANAIMPLMVEGRVLGVLGAAFDAPRAFSGDERATALSVAQQCAQALERARLLEAERAARAEAEKANRVKSEFLAAMSHELRTPLNAIGGYAQLLEMGIYGSVTDAQREALGRIELAQRYLLRHVNDVLNYERLQSGRLEYDVRAVLLADVVGGVEPMIRPQLQTKGISYLVHVSHEHVVRADRDKLTQVIINLLSNAVKFTPAGGRVTIECVARQDGSEDPDTIYLRVADTGIGIPSEKLDTVFEPFVQVDATPAGRASGAGLGLAISRDLARGMGGDLRVRSTLNVGTTFTVALPRANAMDVIDN
ncbi:MAG: ATP-binding protein [bacterium]